MEKTRKSLRTLSPKDDEKTWVLEVIARLMETRTMEVRAKKLNSSTEVEGNSRFMVCKHDDVRFLISGIMGRQPEDAEEYPYLLRVKQDSGGSKGKTRYKILEVLEAPDVSDVKFKKAS